ncbi:GNAT family N-acetyltransferase [Silvimonas iriomotensis]|uniref:N-acetyltransferase domain-containing protein n=1 Tax=Silvimonas iriomotensis TaxID=449662 RepID=A0ABQ2PD36_9NEIS|nr:GNAT family N-acetyltransferase [Silvimonas iriomotensis]GGP23161.1 hypothetical protein GCM10010970_31610 [Silvimonas iriomotensis]
MPIYCGPELALILEHAEALHLARQVAAWQTISADAEARVIPVGGGIAAFTRRDFGRKLNHVCGLGLNDTVTAADLYALETAYATLGLGTEIDLCPHVDPALLPLLADRGYQVNAFSNTYVRALDDLPTLPPHAGRIECRDEVAAAAFIEQSVLGFSVQLSTRPVALLQALARIATQREDTRLFGAWLDGQLAGTAGMAILPSAAGPVAHLYIASTLPDYRGMGVQQALCRARLTAAQAAGCRYAFVTARPANVSARNAERAGLRLAYTKSTFARPAPLPLG